MYRRINGVAARLATAIMLAIAGLAGVAPAVAEDDLHVALGLSSLLRAARTVISTNQALINDAEKADKGLSGEVVLARALAAYTAGGAEDPRGFDPQSRQGRLFQAQMAAIVEVMEENQAVINREGVGFKGFVPAVFARLVNERFKARVGDEAEIKVTAPVAFVRNRKALPDAWETAVIRDKFLSPDWPKNRVLAEVAAKNGREAYRVMVPEYYGAGCLACHGEPKGAIDVTGYPKEGGKLDHLGGAISITLYR